MCATLLFLNRVYFSLFILQNIYPWGWRLSLALAGIPGLMLFIGALCLPDTPNSLIERGKLAEGEKVLQRIRGTSGEFGSIFIFCSLFSTHSQHNPRWKKPTLLMSAYPSQQNLLSIISHSHLTLRGVW